jgi:hypothetical protein
MGDLPNVISIKITSFSLWSHVILGQESTQPTIILEVYANTINNLFGISKNNRNIVFDITLDRIVNII